MTPKVTLQFIKHQKSRVKNRKSCIANTMIKTRYKTQVGGGKNSEETQVGGGKNSSEETQVGGGKNSSEETQVGGGQIGRAHV